MLFDLLKCWEKYVKKPLHNPSLSSTILICCYYPLQKLEGEWVKGLGSRDIWDRLGGQALTMISRWYSRQPNKQNFYSHRLNLNTVSLKLAKKRY